MTIVMILTFLTVITQAVIGFKYEELSFLLLFICILSAACILLAIYLYFKRQDRLEDSPFSSSDIPTVLCSEETFVKLTGIDEYAVIDIQVTKKADKDIDQEIRKLLGDDIKLGDVRESKKSVISAYFGDPWNVPIKELLIILLVRGNM